MLGIHLCTYFHFAHFIGWLIGFVTNIEDGFDLYSATAAVSTARECVCVCVHRCHCQSSAACSEVMTLSLLCFNPVPLLFGRLTWLLGFSFLTNWCPKTALLI